MLVLGFVWFVLLVYELLGSLTPGLETLVTVIWVVFIIDFALKLALAPDKSDYVKSNWLTMIALIVPALRVFRIFRLVRVLRAARAARGLRLFRLLTSVNRGMKSLGASLGRRGFGYVLGITALVIVGGAAGILAFEPDAGINGYGDALWWTAMMITTMGTDFFPRTGEGRILCFVLALYGFAVFGYVTATLATFFVGNEAKTIGTDLPGSSEVSALRSEVRELSRQLASIAGSREPT